MKFSRFLQFTLASLLLTSMLSLGCGDGPRAKHPHAVQGVLDLSDFDILNRNVALDGEWEFHWQKLLAPGEQDTGGKRFLNVPGDWNHFVDPHFATWWPVYGFATYRLKVNLPANAKDLALRIRPQHNPYALWINGRKLLESGKVGTTKDSSGPAAPPQTVRLDSQLLNAGPGATPTLDIQFHFSNFHHNTGGFERQVFLGQAAGLHAREHRTLAGILFLVGSFTIIGLYHLSLFQLRTRDKSPLFFGLICIAWVVRILFTGDRLVAETFPELPFEFSYKTVFLTFTCVLPLFCLYIHALYPEQFSRRILKGIVGAGIFFSLLILLFPMSVYSLLQIPFELMIVPTLGYIFYVVIRAHKKDRPGTLVLLSGMLIFGLTIFNDVANNHDFIRTPDLAPLGLFLFLFSQAYLISLRSADAFHRKEELTINLEQLAADRHRELQAALSDLRQKDELLQQELDIASEIQLGSQPDMPARFGDYYVTAYSRSVGKVGGDFFELLDLSGDRTGVLMADVSGHGVPAALVANMARMSFREEARRRVSPRSIFEHVNSSMTKAIATPEYITAFFIVVGPDGKALFSNAAHRHPAVIRSSGEIEYLRVDGLLLGAFDTGDNSYEEGRTRLEPGDRVVLFTDGLLDAFMEEDPDAWEENFTAFLRERTNQSAEELRNALIDHLTAVDGQKPLHDDITFLIIERGN